MIDPEEMFDLYPALADDELSDVRSDCGLVTRMEENGAIKTAYYDVAGVKLHEEWTRSDGSHGNETYYPDGASSGVVHYADGSSIKYSHDGRGGGAQTSFAARGRKPRELWWCAEGTHTSEVFAAAVGGEGTAPDAATAPGESSQADAATSACACGAGAQGLADVAQRGIEEGAANETTSGESA